MGYGLVAGSNLDVIFSIQPEVSAQTIRVTVNGSCIVLHVLVHQTKVEVDAADIRVVVSTHDFENAE